MSAVLPKATDNHRGTARRDGPNAEVIARYEAENFVAYLAKRLLL
jgi:hypothetical protein